jgi:hypothetical protein
MSGFHGILKTARTAAGSALAAAVAVVLVSLPVQAESHGRLNHLVERIALYPDPLLAQVLTASTYSNQIPDATAWANQHSGLKGDDLENAISEDNLPWDPSVLALLSFPGVIEMMRENMAWTDELGDAVLRDRDGVMDAVQRMRERAMNEGYLRTNGSLRVINSGPGDIEILPVSPGYVCAPVYDPLMVFGGHHVGIAFGALGCGPSVAIGGLYGRWGLGGFGFHWRDHSIVVGHNPWRRDWHNRHSYAHNFGPAMPHFHGPEVEHHHFGHHAEGERASRGDHGHGDRHHGDHDHDRH